MPILKSLSLFILAGLCEIGGALVCIVGVFTMFYTPRATH